MASRKSDLPFLFIRGTLGQIWFISIIVFVLRHFGNTDYRRQWNACYWHSGLSTALWGTIIAVRYKKYSTKKILKDFFLL